MIIRLIKTEDTHETDAMCSLIRKMALPLLKSQTMTLRSSDPLMT
jgi:hypothetical protein